MFGVLGWILFGLVAGVIAKLLMPGRDPGGFIVTILLGIAGAFLGGFLGQMMGFYGEGEPAGLIMSIVGAVLLPRCTEPSQASGSMSRLQRSRI